MKLNEIEDQRLVNQIEQLSDLLIDFRQTLFDVRNVMQHYTVYTTSATSRTFEFNQFWYIALDLLLFICSFNVSTSELSAGLTDPKELRIRTHRPANYIFAGLDKCKQLAVQIVHCAQTILHDHGFDATDLYVERFQTYLVQLVECQDRIIQFNAAKALDKIK